jgi:hypothetical protein
MASDPGCPVLPREGRDGVAGVRSPNELELIRSVAGVDGAVKPESFVTNFVVRSLEGDSQNNAGLRHSFVGEEGCVAALSISIKASSSHLIFA